MIKGYEIRPGCEAQLAALIRMRRVQLSNMMDERISLKKAYKMSYRLFKKANKNK